MEQKQARKVSPLKRPKPIQGIKRFVSRPPAITEAVSETTSGGIVFRRDKSGKAEILLIQDAKKRWTIPKGHVEPGEEPRATAEREIQEESGLKQMRVLNWLGKVDFRYRRNKTLVLMAMHIYLVEALGNTNELKPEAWLNDIKWFPSNEAIDKIEYEDISKLMLLGLRSIRERAR